MKNAYNFEIIRNAGMPPDKETRGRKKGNPKPKNRRRVKYPWVEMKVGDAFDIPIEPRPVPDGRYPEYNAVTACISRRNKKCPERFVARMQDDFRVRVWRVA